MIGFLFVFLVPTSALAASTPSLGAATSYGVLASTYTNTTAGTTINGDIGFTTGPAVVPGGVHPNYGSGAPYATAGEDQGFALTTLAAQPCTFTFAPGAINLSTDTTHGPIGVYTPGVYCSTGAMDVGGPLTLNGSGTYIFRPDGALTSTAGATVTSSGSSACDVFWTPTQATTLAANTTFVGTVIDNAGITVGANTTWSGRALAFGGTVTTDTDTITVPTCASAPATLRVIKAVTNNDSGTAVASDFTLHVKLSGTDVTGSPAAGAVSPGTTYSLAPDTYVVSEDAFAGYAATFSGDCATNGSVTLAAGESKTCTVTNDDIFAGRITGASPDSGTINVVKKVINDNGRNRVIANFPLFINGAPVTSGTTYTFKAPASYTVTETT
ncbi:MAG: ice-binding family protein, partial [bacterium]|nr:ice-binding family protein [bacterium]